jgi:hypothetical protein
MNNGLRPCAGLPPSSKTANQDSEWQRPSLRRSPELGRCLGMFFPKPRSSHEIDLGMKVMAGSFGIML